MSAFYYSLLLSFAMILSPEISSYSITANTGETTITGDTTVSGVGLGRKKKNCNKKGICIIGSDIMDVGIDDRHVIAELGFSGQSLSNMSISYSNITKAAHKEYFSGEHFIMEEAYSGSLKVKDNLYKINIPKGKYPISKGKKGLKIEFN